MNKSNAFQDIDLHRLRDWVSTVSAHLVPVYRPAFFEQMGFPPSLVQQYVENFVPSRANNYADMEPVEGVSGGLFLRTVARVIGADATEGDHKLSMSNRIEAWQRACIKRLDEIFEKGHLSADKATRKIPVTHAKPRRSKRPLSRT